MCLTLETAAAAIAQLLSGQFSARSPRRCRSCSTRRDGVNVAVTRPRVGAGGAGEMRVVVIGGGPAGVSAALHAAELGAEVTLIERRRVGGTAFNSGPAPV